jgi:hypothetical protein
MRRVLEVDLTYPHSYEVEEVREIPGTGKLDIPVLYFPRPVHRPEHDGLWLRIRANKGTPWVGVFAFGYASPQAFSRVVSWADPEHVCVVAGGAGYLVKADEPERWERIPVTPVLDIRSAPEHGLLVLADFTKLAAYGSKGLAWQSPRVCWDELKIVAVSSDRIEGVGYDPMNLDASRPFAVDIKTGRSLFPSPVSVDGEPLW